MNLQNNNADLNAVVNTIVDGVIFIDNRGVIRLFNPACIMIFGHLPDEVLGKNVSILMPEPDRSGHDGYLKNYQTSGQPQIIGIGREVRGLRKSGEVFPMYLSVGESLDRAKPGFVGIIRDLTEESRQAEAFDTLQQNHFHLSRVSAMDQMGAAIAHELNQPLTAIMNYLQAGISMLDKPGAQNRDQLKSVLKKSSDQADRAAQILSRLRQFIETGDVDKRLINVNETLDKAMELVRPSFKNKDIKFVIEMEPSLPPILANSVQIQQVLINLIRNGCEAMDNSDLKTLSITANYKDNEHIVLKISDTGRGLSHEAFEKLFVPFSSTKTGGLGVGLSICKTIIDNHEGGLWVENNNPHGTHFIISLPVGKE